MAEEHKIAVIAVDRYFSDLYKMERLLEKHGFSSWPTEKEVVCKLFDLEDRIEGIERRSDYFEHEGGYHG